VSHAVSLLVSHYGYLALALTVGLESLGLPVPGETALIAASVFAGTTHGLRLSAIVVVAAGAAILGDQVGFAIGRTGGARLLSRIADRSPRRRARVMRIRQIARRGGGRLVILGRFISVVRTYIAILAGASPLRWSRFTACSTLGAGLWATSLGGASYWISGATRYSTVLPTLVGVGLAAVAAGAGIVLARRMARAPVAP
jgi:membrane protein DedA with SNARE-associated domain